MAIEASDELAEFLKFLSGEDFPAVNEDRLFAVAQAHAAAGDDIDAAAPLLLAAVQAFRQGMSGAAERAFVDSMEQYILNDPGYLDIASKYVHRMGDGYRDTATQAQYIKLMIIASLIELMIEFAFFLAMAWLNPGAALAQMASRRAAFQFQYRRWVRRILKQVALSQIVGITIQTLMDAFIQLYQLKKGTRDRWDPDLTKAAVAIGSLGGAVGLGLDGLGNLLKNAFRRPNMGRHLAGGLPDPAPLPGRALPDGAAPGPVPSGLAPVPARNPAASLVNDIGQEALSEYLTEGLYGVLTGNGWQVGWGAPVSGAVSAGVGAAGTTIGTRLNRLVPPPWQTGPTTDPVSGAGAPPRSAGPADQSPPAGPPGPGSAPPDRLPPSSDVLRTPIPITSGEWTSVGPAPTTSPASVGPVRTGPEADVHPPSNPVPGQPPPGQSPGGRAGAGQTFTDSVTRDSGPGGPASLAPGGASVASVPGGPTSAPPIPTAPVPTSPVPGGRPPGSWAVDPASSPGTTPASTTSAGSAPAKRPSDAPGAWADVAPAPVDVAVVPTPLTGPAPDPASAPEVRPPAPVPVVSSTAPAPAPDVPPGSTIPKATSTGGLSLLDLVNRELPKQGWRGGPVDLRKVELALAEMGDFTGPPNDAGRAVFIASTIISGRPVRMPGGALGFEREQDDYTLLYTEDVEEEYGNRPIVTSEHVTIAIDHRNSRAIPEIVTSPTAILPGDAGHARPDDVFEAVYDLQRRLQSIDATRGSTLGRVFAGPRYRVVPEASAIRIERHGTNERMLMHYSVGVPLAGLPGFLEHVRGRTYHTPAQNLLAQAQRFGRAAATDPRMASWSAEERLCLEGYLTLVYTQVIAALLGSTTGLFKDNSAIVSRTPLHEIRAALPRRVRHHLAHAADQIERDLVAHHQGGRAAGSADILAHRIDDDDSVTVREYLHSGLRPDAAPVDQETALGVRTQLPIDTNPSNGQPRHDPPLLIIELRSYGRNPGGATMNDVRADYQELARQATTEYNRVRTLRGQSEVSFPDPLRAVPGPSQSASTGVNVHALRQAAQTLIGQAGAEVRFDEGARELGFGQTGGFGNLARRIAQASAAATAAGAIRIDLHIEGGGNGGLLHGAGAVGQERAEAVWQRLSGLLANEETGQAIRAHVTSRAAGASARPHTPVLTTAGDRRQVLIWLTAVWPPSTTGGGSAFGGGGSAGGGRRHPTDA